MKMEFNIIYENAIYFFNKILVSFFILFVGLLFAGIFEKFTRFVLGELRVNDFLKKGFKFRIDLRKIVSKTVYYFFFFATIILSLNNLGLTWYIIIAWLLFIGLIFALSLILDVKDGLINIYQGLKLNRKIKKKDYIRMNIIKGKVIKKSLVGITVSEKKEIHYIPNVFLKKGYTIKRV